MIKKTLYILLMALMLLSFCACEKTPGMGDAISGTEFDPDDYAPVTMERYEHRNYGIIIEYPSNFEKTGNFELDGYMTFEKDDSAIYVYVPDYENGDILFVEEYATEELDLPDGKGSGISKYGKSTGYKAVEYTDDGVRIDFVVKGVDAFYRFAYETTAEGFTEEDETFQQIMASIRVDDGVYNKLTSMVSRYKTLLEYATSMQYVTDINYVNHSLNNFSTTNEARHKQIAIDTCIKARTEIEEICAYERMEDDMYEQEWEKVIEKATEVIEHCKAIEKAINEGDVAGAQKIARTEINYDLSDAAAAYMSIINSEIAEY